MSVSWPNKNQNLNYNYFKEICIGWSPMQSVSANLEKVKI
jgi:hypothetical protein